MNDHPIQDILEDNGVSSRCQWVGQYLSPTTSQWIDACSADSRKKCKKKLNKMGHSWGENPSNKMPNYQIKELKRRLIQRVTCDFPEKT